MINPRLLICKYNTLPNRKLSKNGAVKRVMFDGGYATFSEGGCARMALLPVRPCGECARGSRHVGARRADKPLLPLLTDSQAVVGASGSSPAPSLATWAPFQAPLQLRADNCQLFSRREKSLFQSSPKEISCKKLAIRHLNRYICEKPIITS